MIQEMHLKFIVRKAPLTELSGNFHGLLLHVYAKWRILPIPITFHSKKKTRPLLIAYGALYRLMTLRVALPLYISYFGVSVGLIAEMKKKHGRNHYRPLLLSQI
jgi:hypothetical protein